MSELRPEDIYLTRAWLEKHGWVPTNTIPMFRNNSACIDADLCVVVDSKDYIIAKFHYMAEDGMKPSAKPYSFEVCGINNYVEMLDYDHTRLAMAAYVCHLTGFEEIDKAIGGVYGKDYYTLHYTTEWPTTKNVIVSLYETGEHKPQIGIVEVRIFRGESPQKGEAYIWNLFVDEQHRCKGYGRALLSDALDLAMLNDCHTAVLEWDKRESPQWVFDWYTRHGFDEKEFGPGYALMKKDMSNYANE